MIFLNRPNCLVYLNLIFLLPHQFSNLKKNSEQKFERSAITKEAKKLHEQSIVVDLHVDPIIQHFIFGYDISKEHHPSWKPEKHRLALKLIKMYAGIRGLHRPFFNHIDLPRMLKGGYTAGGFGIHFWPFQLEMGWEGIKNQINYFHQVVEKENNLILGKSPEDIRHAFKQRKLAGFMGVEGAHCLGKGGSKTIKRRLDRIEELFEDCSVRYLTLAHFSKNDFATPCMGLGSNPTNGLTEFGKELIRKMNEVGMIIDVAHVNDQGVLDACKVSIKPVLVTHTGLAGRHSHRRNISDSALKAVADTGGVVGVMFATNFLSKSRDDPNTEIVMEHLEHIITQVGEEHTAIGSDFDGWISGIPQDMDDAKDLPLLTQSMTDRGYTPECVKKILGENFLRVWKEILNV